ncbi:MAG: alpha/beta hydrolase, partial [Bacteriovoracaceae bacterium]
MKAFFLIFIAGIVSSCSTLFYQPARETFYLPQNFNLNYDEVKIETSDKVKLNGWWLKNSTQESKGVILFFHGNAENISTHCFNLAWTTKYGYELLCIDYRGYGNSEGKPNQQGTYLDAIASMDYAYEKIFLPLKKLHPKLKFIIYAQSLGGIITGRAVIDWKNREQINLLVLDSTFSSYQNIAFDKLKSVWLTFLLSPLAYLLISDEMEFKSKIDLIKPIPTLVIHGDSDPVIPQKFGKEIFD